MAVDYSIIVPVYFNEGSLRDGVEAIKRDVIARNPARVGEIIFVDDGSGDRSMDELLRLRQENPSLIKVVKLTRNFGQVNAWLAGFSRAQGRCVVTLSADGQDPAALIHDMLAAHFEEKHEVVICAREGRDESAYRTATSRFFYWLMRKLSFPEMPAGGFDFFLLGRRALDAILQNREDHSFFQGQVLWTGYRPKFIPYRRLARASGASRWTLGKKITYLIDGVMGYSFLPIRFMALLGLVFALLGFAYALLIVLLKLLGGIPMKGWAPLMIMILIIGGLQMVMISVIGEYVWRTLAQARNRAPYVIEAVYD